MVKCGMIASGLKGSEMQFKTEIETQAEESDIKIIQRSAGTVLVVILGALITSCIFITIIFLVLPKLRQ